VILVLIILIVQSVVQVFTCIKTHAMILVPRKLTPLLRLVLIVRPAVMCVQIRHAPIVALAIIFLLVFV